MYTFSRSPSLMIQLATSTRADQIERAQRRRAHHPEPLEGSIRRRGYWGGLHRRAAKAQRAL